MVQRKHSRRKAKLPGCLALPFFIMLAVLTVVSFCIPLRPTQSQMEKRSLTPFPDFTLEALVDGSYFDDINLWFSDTFPGREMWLQVASFTKSLHGSSELAIQGELPMELVEVPPSPTEQEEPTEEATEPVTLPVVTEPVVTEPEPTEWGGVDAANDEDILWTESVIQIGDSVFSALGFSQASSNSYIATVNRFARQAAEAGITVVSAPPPTAVGILVEEEFQYKLRSSSQKETLRYLHDGMDQSVVKVDTVSALLPHNHEYIYFRTDHHWTALGAYYSYQAMCQAIGMEPVDLDTLEIMDLGEFSGSLYGRAKNPWKLRRDNVLAYVPQGDISNTVYYNSLSGNGQDYPVLATGAAQQKDTKYLVFGTDWPINHLENRSIPDAPNCIVVKDSFGNCFVPFLTQNFNHVYAIDYRKFQDMPLLQLAQQMEAEYVIFIPYLAATQSETGVNILNKLCR